MKIQHKIKTPIFVHKDVKKLFVERIPPTTTFGEFKSYFQNFGELTDAFPPKKSELSPYDNGFGFVT